MGRRNAIKVVKKVKRKGGKKKRTYSCRESETREIGGREQKRT